MAIVLWSTAMSLDGFIAGPHDAMDWVFRFAEPGENADDVIQSTGSILAGRRSYDVGRKPDQRPEAQEPFGGAWSGPQFVLTHRAPTDETDPAITFLQGDIGLAVATATEAAAGKNVLILGADVARQCVERHLVDEILILLVPILLGGGTRLFAREGKSIALRTAKVTQFGQVTHLRFTIPPQASRS